MALLSAPSMSKSLIFLLWLSVSSHAKMISHTSKISRMSSARRSCLSIEVSSQSRENFVLNMRGGSSVNNVVVAPSGVSSGKQSSSFKLDVSLLVTFAFWFLGNYYYNIWNKLCLKAAGGSKAFPMTISTLQLGVGCIYAALLYLFPFVRSRPKVTRQDIISMLPVSFAAMGAHSASVFALSAGAVSFAQIVKSAEPVYAAFISVFFHGKSLSIGKWFMLLPIIGGVVLASCNELDFAWSALISASIANIFAAVKGSENKKLLDKEGIKERIGGVGNQFAITTFLAFLLSIPVMIIKEGHKFNDFLLLLQTNPIVRDNLIKSGLAFYGYNELATLSIKKTNAVTQSVANTAKRVVVILGVALVMGESLSRMKFLGCSIAIGGVFLYSIIDNLI